MRRWLVSLSYVPGTIARTMSTFTHHRLGIFVPFVGFLMLLAGVMWIIHAVAPLAPFVYSLF
jgi:hypothetical protein